MNLSFNYTHDSLLAGAIFTLWHKYIKLSNYFFYSS